MNTITHALVGWSIAHMAPLDRRDRTLVTLAGVIPDLDGLGIVVDLMTRSAAHPTELWGTYHHVLGHNAGMGLALAIATAIMASRRWPCLILALLSFHLHLLGDVIGSLGPDGYQWPIPYLLPFSDAWQLTWSGQWALNAWPNIVLTAFLLLLSGYWAWQRGYSPLEGLSPQADAAFVLALRHRFGSPEKAGSSGLAP